MGVETGGKTVYGASVGILMLETRFPRIPGDIGNALTWPFPVQYRIVSGASPDQVVRRDPMVLLPNFIAAARDLVASGCDGLTTNCGFLALMQAELAEAVDVPVATSSLLQVPVVQRMLPPGQRVGVLTISADSLTGAHLEAAGIDDVGAVPIVGTDPEGEFSRGILDDHDRLDFDKCAEDLSLAADRLVTERPDVGAIVLECTNMVPYAADIRRRTGRPVFSIFTLVQHFHAGLVPRRFSGGIDDPRIPPVS